MNLLQTAPGAASAAESLLAAVSGRTRLQGACSASPSSQTGTFADLLASLGADTAPSDLPSGASQGAQQHGSSVPSDVRQMVHAVLLKSSLKQTEPPQPVVPASAFSDSQYSDLLPAPQSIPEASQGQGISDTEDSSHQAADAQNLAEPVVVKPSDLTGQATQSNSILRTDPNLIALSGLREGQPADALIANLKKDRDSAKHEAEQVNTGPATAKTHVAATVSEATLTASNTAAPQTGGNPTVTVPQPSELGTADLTLSNSALAVRDRRESTNQQAVNALLPDNGDYHQAPVNGEFSAMAAVTDASPSDSADHLAFALQVAPVQGDHAGSNPPLQNGISKAAAIAAAAGAGDGSAHAAPPFMAISQTAGFSAASAPHTREARGTGSPESAFSASDVHFEPKTASGDPLRVLRVQFAGANDQRVDVRVADAGGELRVSVRSSEPGLTQALQDHMPELTSRLSEQSFHASVWMPPASSGAATGPRPAMAFSVNVNPDGRGHQSRRENQQHHPKPEWIDDLKLNPLGKQMRRS